MKIGDLPEDMRVLLGQIAMDSGGWKFSTKADSKRFEKVELPLLILPLGAFPKVSEEHDPGDERKFEEYLDTPIEDYPPVVIAHGVWIDGRHRVWAAREQGESEIRAVDASGILGREFVEDSLFLGHMDLPWL